MTSKEGREVSVEENFTVLFSMTAKAGREEECRELVTRIAETTRAEDEGCIHYIWHQQIDNPREFVLYEHWRDQAAVDAHLARLQATGGAMDIAENIRSIRLRVVG